MEASDLLGKRFGKLVAIKRVRSSAFGHARWLWKCDCGNEKEIFATSVKRGLTTSCGCFQSESRTTHGYFGTKTYDAWRNMKARVAGNGDWNKKYYLDRGILVCDRWKDSFENFLFDMGECPDGMTLERIDNDKGYDQSNCCWATQAKQMTNTRRTRNVKFEGKTMCLLYACKRAGISYRTVLRHIQHGMTPQQAIDRSILTK